MSITVGDVLLKLGLDTSGFTQQMAGIQQSAKDAAENIKNQFDAIGKASLAIGGAITGAIGLSIKSAADEEQAMLRLGSALKNAGTDFKSVKGPLDDTIMSMEKMSAVSHDQLYSAFTKLLNITGNYEESLTLLPIALDLARGANIDLETASMLMGKVMEGNTSMLSRYGIVLKEGATKTEALDAISKRFGGSAKAMGESTNSAMSQIKLSIDKLTEGIGAIFLPTLKNVAKQISGVIDWVVDWTEKNPALTAVIAVVTGALGLLLLGLGTYITLSKSATVQAVLHITKLGLQAVATGVAAAAQWALNVAMTAGLGPVGAVILIITALTGGVYGLVKGIQWLIGSNKENTDATIEATAAEKAYTQAIDEAKAKIAALNTLLERQTTEISDAEKKLQAAKDSSGGYSTSIARLNLELTNTNYALNQARDKLATIQKSYDAASTKVKGFEDAISSANRELDKLSNPRLTGMQANEDEQFTIEQKIKQLQLQKAELYGQSLAIQAQVQALKDVLSTTNNLTEAQRNQREAQIKALEATDPTIVLDKAIEAWQNELDIVRLKGETTFDPLIRNSKEAVETAQGLNNEIAPADMPGKIQTQVDIIAGLTTQLGLAKDEMDKQNVSLTLQQGVVDKLSSTQKDIEVTLAAITNITENEYFAAEQKILDMKQKEADLQLQILAAVKAKADLEYKEMYTPPDIYGYGAGQQNTDANGALLPPLASHASGGWIAEKSMIVRMRDMKPTGTMAENRPEYISPTGPGGSGQDSAELLRTIAGAIQNGFNKVSIMVQVGSEDVAAVVFREGYRELQK